MLLKTLIPFLSENSKNTKIHFAQGFNNWNEALEVYENGDFKEWQEHQRKKNFERDFILSLIRFGADEWLFVGVYKSLSSRKVNDVHYKYKTELTDVGSELIGRVIVRYKRTFRASYCCLENYIDNLEVVEVKRNENNAVFPGYEDVCVSWKELDRVINTESWKTALQNMKGVYLITDKSNGKLYVGSATGSEMIWGRWKDYLNTGHGGNEELKKLKFEHIQKYFQYTILDIYKPSTDDQDILDREDWWKDVLMSRDLRRGYNLN